MDIMVQGNTCKITPSSPLIDEYQTKRLLDTIREFGTYKIGINLDNVYDCTINFLDSIKNISSISLYNINSDLFAIITKMKIDKCVNIYNSELDFCTSSHRLLNREFKIVCSQ